MRCVDIDAQIAPTGLRGEEAWLTTPVEMFQRPLFPIH